MLVVFPRKIIHIFLPVLFILPLLVAPSCNRSAQKSPGTSVSKLEPQQDHRRAKNPLSDYVYTPDDAFEYEIAFQKKESGYTFYVLRMISQEWLSTKEVVDPTWWHWVSVVVPDGEVPETGFLFISGGSRSSNMPEKASGEILEIAKNTRSVVAKLHNVPNQHTVFKNDDFGPRKEDELIAFGWRRFLEGGGQDKDGEWLARFPMTKAAVRAMDAITDLTQKENKTNTIKKYVVAGASKRGWTTWTTGAVDKRVVAIAPLVIDLLNMVPSFQHHWRAYGRWADAIYDYNHEGIMEWQDSKEYEALVRLTEPYSFLDQLTIPKLILNAAGDQFFLPDSWQFYWKDLKGEKHLRYIPNTDHGMKNSDVLTSLISFYQMILANQSRPDFDWSVKDGVTSIKTNDNHKPIAVKLWKAHNPAARNFQLKEIGEAYQSQDIPIEADGKYTITVDAPSEGWTAYFVELTFPGVDQIPLKLTTGTVVLPDEYPYPPFESKDPKGHQQ
ncbi:PhoPQ-activated pathogenicity-related family protein [Membranicola marinus]|uniref:PhoPQ-activated pathogenicity-related family protein n=1 Tax=Membranihabitans marinus TaxID=1227546 RepID=A0A953HJL3_9BACT|nr:PhoPQ-activated pathogenicity-related family protein [Membranihabitans marinus]MBY5956917.1 PhoPQ-activated pathogenicity-related family protein [Membranihabitans marinus]